ncbi:hypothetical protein DL766_001282 [Monosporascus sp. MC13-8B]|uniref:Uncharacterized protein n=1 Tax=Monosporascus cannonballus TaxID=155416 RepID=A0ABY0GY61_9PEZI|nr:hypothetical protein DL762_007778 [Monosporascus cannonballus]RYO84036.1 hypothetical protein DL763_007635 [Monosporascus cannonballus]RYP37794.1 hypothetical protein DL766_001282 [Monosporascus sp. MC13-8B]
MGRWGLRLFEGDKDWDIACDLESTFEGEDEGKNLKFFDLVVFRDDDEEIVGEMRDRLDSGLGDELFDIYRAREKEYGGEYRVVILGALAMRTGARIRPGGLGHLRDLVCTTTCRHGAQFLAALDHYKPGVPRAYGPPSCFHCGKMKADTGGEPLRITRIWIESFMSLIAKRSRILLEKLIPSR